MYLFIYNLNLDKQFSKAFYHLFFKLIYSQHSKKLTLART